MGLIISYLCYKAINASCSTFNFQRSRAADEEKSVSPAPPAPPTADLMSVAEMPPVSFSSWPCPPSEASARGPTFTPAATTAVYRYFSSGTAVASARNAASQSTKPAKSPPEPLRTTHVFTRYPWSSWALPEAGGDIAGVGVLTPVASPAALAALGVSRGVENVLPGSSLLATGGSYHARSQWLFPSVLPWTALPLYMSLLNDM